MSGSTSFIVPVPVMVRFPPFTKNTLSGAVISFPFRLILTFLFIFCVPFNDTSDNNDIVSFGPAFANASSNVS